METDTKILIALISASSAIAGAVFSQFFSIVRDVLDKRHQRRIFLRDKYEGLSNEITNSHDWFNRQLSAVSLEQLRVPAFEARRAMVISYIYFPLLRNACQDYVNACATVQVTLMDCFRFVEGVDAGTQAGVHDRERFLKVTTELRKCRQHLDELIIRYASKYAGA